MIIDAHIHPDWCGYDCDKLLANMEQYQIGRAWLLSWECPAADYPPSPELPDPSPPGPIAFARCLAYANRAPDKFILGYAPDPRQPQALELLQTAVAVHQVRVCGELKVRMRYDSPQALDLFRACAKLGLPVILHLDCPLPPDPAAPPGAQPGYWYGGEIEALEHALQACPKTIFLGHAPGFWSHISADAQSERIDYPKGLIRPGGKLIALLRKYPNLYCDGSANSAHNALIRDLKFARAFLLEFQDRFLYARDLFDNRHQELLNSLNLPAAVLAKIYSGNALKLVPQA